MFSDHHEALECPKCGKKVLVRQDNTRYSCLWCGFHRDISQPRLGGLEAIISALAALFLLMFLL